MTLPITEEDPNPENFAVVAQQERCIRAIWERRAEGWVHRVTLSDPGCSGMSASHLGLQLLIELVKARAIKVVVVHRRNRLSRSIELLTGIQAILDRHGVKVYSCNEGMCVDGPRGRLQKCFAALVAPKPAMVRQPSILGRRMLRALKANGKRPPGIC